LVVGRVPARGRAKPRAGNGSIGGARGEAEEDFPANLLSAVSAQDLNFHGPIKTNRRDYTV
jgi:hypothetical protein